MGLRDQWYKNAIISCLDVESYADSDGDGVGDFKGLTHRLDSSQVSASPASGSCPFTHRRIATTATTSRTTPRSIPG